MPRFFIENASGEQLVISGNDAIHISKSLRMKNGEEIILTSKGFDYRCEIAEISSDEVVCNIISSEKCQAEPSVSVTLYQAMPKLDKLEFIIQKATELGVKRVVPVLTTRCISRPDEKSFGKKLDRLKKIALEAAKQSGRGIVPQIEGIISLDEALLQMQNDEISLVCYERGGQSMSDFDWEKYQSISILIGSEGGFSPEEITKAHNNGVSTVWLGNRILRCETAPIAAISIIMHLTKNL